MLHYGYGGRFCALRGQDVDDLVILDEFDYICPVLLREVALDPEYALPPHMVLEFLLFAAARDRTPRITHLSDSPPRNMGSVESPVPPPCGACVCGAAHTPPPPVDYKHDAFFFGRAILFVVAAAVFLAPFGWVVATATTSAIVALNYAAIVAVCIGGATLFTCVTSIRNALPSWNADVRSRVHATQVLFVVVCAIAAAGIKGFLGNVLRCGPELMRDNAANVCVTTPFIFYVYAVFLCYALYVAVPVVFLQRELVVPMPF